MGIPLVISDVTCSGLRKLNSTTILKFIAGGTEVANDDQGKTKSNAITWDATYRV
jgi:hypothetical protein